MFLSEGRRKKQEKARSKKEEERRKLIGHFAMIINYFLRYS
jgi:hypothetical protein